MLKVGITGGIGSGKSFVCKIFATIPIPIYNSDKRSKWLMNNDAVLMKEVERLFGKEAYKEGTLNRAYLASIVFNDKEKLKQLEAIVHPAVQNDTEKWFKQQGNEPYGLKEAAIIFEKNLQAHFEKIIVVTAPKELRITRTMEREKCTREAVLSRMGKQMPQEEKVKLADYVILNDQQIALLPQVVEIHKQLTALI